MTQSLPIRRGPSGEAAFSLLELLVAMGLGGALAAVMLQLLLQEGQGLQRLGRALRERSHQQRTLELIRGDVQRAVAVSATPELESHACSLAGRRPVLHLSMALGPPVTYSVGAAPSGIWRGQVLMRCGTAFGLDGQPTSSSTAQNRVVLDGLARPLQSWQECGLKIGGSSVSGVWLNGSEHTGLAACRSTDGLVVEIWLFQEIGALRGKTMHLKTRTMAGLG